MKRLCCLVFLFSFLFIGRSTAFAGPPISYLGIEQGLSNNAVTCIYQDKNGFMWFGTYDGLNKYDGYDFKVFTNIMSDSTSLASNSINAIGGDNYYNVWVGGLKGVSVYNPIRANFSAAKYYPFKSSVAESYNEDVTAIKLAAKNHMLVGGKHHGLIDFIGNTKTGRQVPLKINDRLNVSYFVSAIEYDSINNISWVLVQNEGLCTYDIKTQTLLLFDASITNANCVHTDGNGRVWIGDNNNIYTYNTVTKKFSNGFIPRKTKVVNVCVDKKKALWIATDGDGLWVLPNGATQAHPFIADANTAINSNAIYSVYEDNDGRKWIGTLRGGINVLDCKASPFKTITYRGAGDNNLVNNFILSFCEDEKNNVWIGTDGAGLRYWNRSSNSFKEYKHDGSTNSISSNFITSIVRDHTNQLWISTWFGGINRLTKNSGAFEKFTCHNPITKANENNVWLVYEDAHHTLWASATNDGSLYSFNSTANRFEIFDPSITNLQCLAEDKSGLLWGGNYSSLIKIDVQNKKHVTYNIGYPVRCLHEDKNHNFWVGTQGGGLLLFDRKTATYKQYTTNDGLPNNTVLRILEDAKGNLWMSTFNGLCKYNAANKTYRNYSSSDGLQSNQFSFNAAVALRSGAFLFGGIKGFNEFSPDSLNEQPSQPQIFLTGLKINNVPISKDDSYIIKESLDKIEEIRLPYNKAALNLDFVALAFSGNDKLKYAYYLKGWDKGWNYVNNIRSANYSRLEEGTYTFEIKVCNQFGKWSEGATLLKIQVLPPWYRTWWAYLLYACIIAATIYWYLRYKSRQTKLEYDVKIAHLNAEKEREINEKKLAFFTDVSHEFRTPLTLIINPVKDLIQQGEKNEDHKELNIVYRNARRLLSLVDQLLLFRKADTESDRLKLSKANLISLCNEVFLCFVQQAKAKQLIYRLEYDKEEIDIYCDREKLEIAMFNLISNAIKYTPKGGEVVVKVTEKTDRVEVAVTDTGTGISKDAGEDLFKKFYQAKENSSASKGGFGIGLYLVKHFVEKHKGEVSYQSEPGVLTTFTLQLRKGKDHFAGETIVEEDSKECVILQELTEETPATEVKNDLDVLITDHQSLLIVDDDAPLRSYVSEIFKAKFTVYEAANGEEGLALATKNCPDIIISDIAMNGMTGIELCKKIKQQPSLNHIPVILLTGSLGSDLKLKGIEGGADDYITKPFEKNLLVASVANILKSRNNLQQYFYNEITLQKTTLKVSEEYKQFLDKCITIVEKHLDDEQFTIKTFANEIGMSHSNLYKKIKTISGQSLNGFIRFIRLRKAAELFIHTDSNVNQVAMQVGFADVKYFREQFNKLFSMNPSEYIKKYRAKFGRNYTLTSDALRSSEVMS